MKLGFPHVKKFPYERLMQEVDARAVLAHYGAENTSEVTGPDGTVEVIHSCLLDRVEPHHANGDSHPSAACNIDKKLYVCYNYWGGSLLHLIQKMEGFSTLEETAPSLDKFLGEPLEPDELVAQLKALTDAFDAIANPHREPPMPVYSDRVLAHWERHRHPYLAERGIDLTTAERLHIGWDETENRIVIPHFWNGQLVGWQKRVVPTTVPDTPKYRSSTGFPKSTTLYGFTGQKEVIVVESPMSVIKAVALGVPDVLPVAVATFGAKVSDTQIDLLGYCDQIFVWMDDDSPGRLAEQRLLRKLLEESDNADVRVVRSDPGRDLADCTALWQVSDKLDTAELPYEALSRYEKEGFGG